MRKNTNQSVAYLVIFTQQSGSLTARMHHNSQKRINTSKLFWDLYDLTLTQQSQIAYILRHHFSSSVFTTPLIQQHQRPPRPEHPARISVIFFLTSLFTSAAHGALARSTTVETLYLRLSLILPTSALQRLIKDYRTIYIYIYIQWYHQWRWGLLVKCVTGSAGVRAHRNRHAFT